MRKKHIRSLMAVAVMSAMLVTGCGDDGGSSSKKSGGDSSGSGIKEFTAFLQHLVQKLMTTMRYRRLLQKRQV